MDRRYAVCRVPPTRRSTANPWAFHLPLLRFAFESPAVRMTATVSGAVVLVEKTEAERMNRLKGVYLDKIVPLLKDVFSYTNIHQVPKLEKIVVNCDIGDAAQNAKGLDAAMNNVALIAGQRPVKTRQEFGRHL